MPKVELAAGSRVLACRVFEPELDLLGIGPQEVTYLEQGLHRYPQDLRKEIAQALAALEIQPHTRKVIIAYGYCGGGLEGLVARRAELVIPRSHDCIPLLLGGPVPPRLTKDGQSFFLSAGWIDHGRTPFTEYQYTAEKYGEEDARWVGRQILKGYKRVALITGKQTRAPKYRRHAQAAAKLFDLQYNEEPGRLAWLRELLAGVNSPRVLVLPPGVPVKLDMFPQDQEPQVKTEIS